MSNQNIGRYEVKAEIGRGGMASVVLAYDPNFQRDVAIKVLPPSLLNDPQFRTRFAREARMVALLEHAAILPVYDFGEDEGRPFIVMRYMSGGSLADKLKAGPMDMSEAASVISRIAPALDAAHARGVVHRDLKPANILFDQYGNSFLSDFGIARLAEGGSGTLTGSLILGTPAYMSPEQARGDPDLDGRCDIYSLGATLFEMLTGRAPYQADTPMGQVMKHITEPVPNILKVRDDLPVGVQAVIEKSMAKDRNDRFATATEMSIMLNSAAQTILGVQPTAHGGAGLGTGSGSVLTGSALTGSALTGAKLTGPAGPDSPQTVPGQVGAASPTNLAPGVGGRTAISGELGGREKPATGAIPRRGLSPALMAVIGLVVVAAVVVGGVFGLNSVRQNQAQATLSAQATAAALIPTEVKVTPTPDQPTATTSAPPSPTATLEATEVAVVVPTEAPTTPTERPQPSPTPEPTKLPAVGGADKIAYLSGNNLFMANMDGSELVQLTVDNALKTDVQWAPEGDSILYLLGKCVSEININSTRVEQLFCLNAVEIFSSFEVSPDGTQLALTIDNQLYIVPFDREKLRNVKSRRDLSTMAVCAEFAPLAAKLIKDVRWSADGTKMAATTLIPLNGVIADSVSVFSVADCTAKPQVFDNFPAERFKIGGYDEQPTIQYFSWDGDALFALTNIVRNGGFGDLYIYNMSFFRAQVNVNPIENLCCYRNPTWSPDGSHLLVAFQDIKAGASSVTRLYMLPYGTIGTGSQYQPMPLPDITSPRESPLPILRPAR